jgi:hypothetical protein
MRMDPGRGAGDVAQIRSKSAAPVNEMGRGKRRGGNIAHRSFTHQPTHTANTEITPAWRRQQPSTHALGHSE